MFSEARKPLDNRPRIEGVLFFDGSCWPNPGPNSRAGFVIHIGDKLIEKTVHLGDGTNNTAEYNALILGMIEADANGVTHLDVYGDSQLVIGGVKRGIKKGRNPKGKPHLEELKAKAVEISKRFASVEFIWIPREQNTQADELSTSVHENATNQLSVEKYTTNSGTR